MAWTVRVKVKEGVYDIPINDQWVEEDKKTPEAVSETVLRILKDRNPPLIVIVKTKPN